MNTKRNLFALIAAVAVVSPIGLPQPAQAQGMLKKHPIASGIVAGAVAHHMAKKGAANRAASGRKPNFAERHPMMSGLAAGAATHHMLKKK